MDEVQKYASSKQSHLTRSSTVVQALEKHMKELKISAEDKIENEILDSKSHLPKICREPWKFSHFDSHISSKLSTMDKSGVQEEERNMRQSDSSRFKRIEDQCVANNLEIQRVSGWQIAHRPMTLEGLFQSLYLEGIIRGFCEIYARNKLHDGISFWVSVKEHLRLPGL
eukprot:Gb_14736 [translate_table: standard]